MHANILSLCAAVLLGATGTESGVEQKELHAVESQIIEQTNIRRRQHGLRELTVDMNLVKSARRHAIWMTSRRALQHTNEAVAENIAMGQRTAAEAVRDWMSSSGHRANILRQGHGRIGVAAYVASDGTIYWCQQFLQ